MSRNVSLATFNGLMVQLRDNFSDTQVHIIDVYLDFAINAQKNHDDYFKSISQFLEDMYVEYWVKPDHSRDGYYQTTMDKDCTKVYDYFIAHNEHETILSQLVDDYRRHHKTWQLDTLIGTLPLWFLRREISLEADVSDSPGLTNPEE